MTSSCVLDFHLKYYQAGWNLHHVAVQGLKIGGGRVTKASMKQYFLFVFICICAAFLSLETVAGRMGTVHHMAVRGLQGRWSGVVHACERRVGVGGVGQGTQID
jgi:hypothetical protein